MKKLFTLLFVLGLLVGCTNGKASVNDNITFKNNISFSGTIIDMIDGSDTEGFYLLIEPIDTDHNSTILLKSKAGQTKEIFTKDQTYTFVIYVIVDSSSNRLELNLVSFTPKD